MNLSLIRGVVMDMDGVLWRGDQILPGVAAFFDFLRSRHLPFVLASNNSSKTPADYVAKLSGLGVPGVAPQQVVTSGTATVDYLRTHYPAGAVVHVLGGDGLKAMVSGAGFVLSEDAKIVVVGIDFNLTYDKLRRATYLIRAGADFIGTNDDATYPMPEGLSPGAGSILAALRASTDRQPTIMGKPNQPMFDVALHVMGTERGVTLMIGDRLNTDIQGAQAAGLFGVLVLTGVATRESLAHSPVMPDGVYDDLPALMAAWS
jgi:4-nitrophenyl phosphatase